MKCSGTFFFCDSTDLKATLQVYVRKLGLDANYSLCLYYECKSCVFTQHDCPKCKVFHFFSWPRQELNVLLQTEPLTQKFQFKSNIIGEERLSQPQSWHLYSVSFTFPQAGVNVTARHCVLHTLVCQLIPGISYFIFTDLRKLNRKKILF